jgi:hypothetical protein
MLSRRRGTHCRTCSWPFSSPAKNICVTRVSARPVTWKGRRGARVPPSKGYGPGLIVVKRNRRRVRAGWFAFITPRTPTGGAGVLHRTLCLYQAQ